MKIPGLSWKIIHRCKEERSQKDYFIIHLDVHVLSHTWTSHNYFNSETKCKSLAKISSSSSTPLKIPSAQIHLCSDMLFHRDHSFSSPHKNTHFHAVQLHIDNKS